MKPISYNKKGNDVYFHYSFRDLKHFLKIGFDSGDCGMLLISFVNGFMKFKGFGTLEHPRKEIITFTLKHNSRYDGEFSIEKIMNPVSKLHGGKYSYIMIDFSK